LELGLSGEGEGDRRSLRERRNRETQVVCHLTRIQVIIIIIGRLSIDGPVPLTTFRRGRLQIATWPAQFRLPNGAGVELLNANEVEGEDAGDWVGSAVLT
jgi:hypothetical protein